MAYFLSPEAPKKCPRCNSLHGFGKRKTLKVGSGEWRRSVAWRREVTCSWGLRVDYRPYSGWLRPIRLALCPSGRWEPVAICAPEPRHPSKNGRAGEGVESTSAGRQPLLASLARGSLGASGAESRPPRPAGRVVLRRVLLLRGHASLTSPVP